MEKSISILGCGWLGFPLAIRLVANGWQVKGSTTTDAKLPALREKHIDAYLVQLGNDASLNNEFLDSDVLFLNVPPSLKKQNASAYLMQIQSLVKCVERSPVKQVIFISSTSVYPDGNSEIIGTGEVDTNSALYQSEQLFRVSKKFTTTVIRFAGLIGPGRNPARFFAGKVDVPNGQAPVNLIHLEDCLGIIEAVLNQQKFGGTYHASAPSHSSRKEFYTLAAETVGLPVPGFVDELKEWKLIDPGKLITALEYQFRCPDVLQCIAAKACG